VASILFIFFLTPYLESRGSDGIYALAWGVLAGGFVQLMIQVPLLKKIGFTFSRPSSFFSPALKKILKRLIPGLVGVAAAQINILINTVLATSSIVGSVSWLNYAFRLFSFPLGILSVALGSSTLVHFSDAWKSHQRAKALDILQRSTFYSWALVAIPFIFLAIFSDWLVVLVYERGLFQINDSLQTTKALFWYGLGLPFYGLLKVLVPIFYTIDRAKIPMYTALVSLSVNVIYSLIFIGDLGHVALAQATTLSVTTNGLLLLFFLNKYLDLPWNFFLSKNLNCLIFSTAICLIPAWYMHQHIPFFAFHNMIQLVILGLIAIIFLLLFETLLYFFGVGPIFINRIKFLKF